MKIKVAYVTKVEPLFRHLKIYDWLRMRRKILNDYQVYFDSKTLLSFNGTYRNLVILIDMLEMFIE